jgi:phospholipid/cholesterol/gamma-HCH transport system ATP-binding protein
MTAPPKVERPKLEWKGVSKRFDGPVLDGLDLSVAAGRSLVIIGGSGQGKSVTIKVAMGLMRPDAGQVLVDGENLIGSGLKGGSGAARRKLFERIGVLFQGAALFDSLSVWENVAFRLINADGVPRKEAKARAIEALGRVHLGFSCRRLLSVRAVGRHAEAGRPGPGRGGQSRDHLLRRADHGPGPDHLGGDQ